MLWRRRKGRPQAPGEERSTEERSTEELLAEVDAFLGPAYYTCPRCEARTPDGEWETAPPPIDETRIADEAYVRKVIDEANLTCPACGYSETRKELEGYLEFENEDDGRWWHERAVERLVIGKHANPTWNRRLGISLVMLGLGAAGVLWWLIDRSGFDSTFDDRGPPRDPSRMLWILRGRRRLGDTHGVARGHVGSRQSS